MNPEVLQEQFADYEDKTGLKFPFNIFPRTKDQESKCIIPISCLYQPLRPKENPIVVESYPIACLLCKSILNAYCLVDVNSRVWSCSICGNRNQFPSDLNQLPIEMNPNLLDIEYIIPQNRINDANPIRKPTIFMFIVDLALDDDELTSLKENLIISIDLLPPNSMISLITYGKNVNVHEIVNQDCHSFYTFNGSKEYTRDGVTKRLGIMKKNIEGLPNANNIDISNRFVQQKSMCEYSLTDLIDSLKKDSFKTPQYHRKERSTGCALNIAFHILSTLYPKVGSRIMLFTGGACTIGPGSIVSTNLKDPIRSHHDLVKDAKISKKFKHNVNFYQNIAEKASINGHSFDIFIGCYDQIGLNEMECLVNKTGGVIVQSDSFTSAIFRQSLHKFLALNEDGESQFGLNATLEVKSTNIKVNGLIGHATPLHLNKGNNMNNNNNNNKIKFYSEMKNNKKIGLSGTNCWKLGSVSTHSTYAIYFDLNENVVGDYSVIQFITSYQHPDGTQHIHVTTSQRFINQNRDSMESIIDNFDQEAATVIIARQAIFTVLNDSTVDALRFTNKILIDFLSVFAKYKTGDSKSIIIPMNVNLFPQFIYHLRRSNFIQIFNASPDETSFYRHCFLTEDCINTLIMIQPTLTAYEIENEPEPVLLDSTSIKPNRILFLDTFFHILIFHGSLIADWRRQGYQNQPDYEYFKEFLELPRQEAADILVDRFPLPRFIDTEEGGSQARFLMSKLNPTTSYNSFDSLDQMSKLGPQDGNGGAIIMTDDISLQTFMQFVYDAVVKPT